jgi:NAD(P)-dependent dehydrogenase (short-subunit alcohol dehydrogenase family)
LFDASRYLRAWSSRMTAGKRPTLEPSKIPMRRFGKPEEIARAVLFLCTDATTSPGNS